MSVETCKPHLLENVREYNLLLPEFNDDLDKIAEGYASVTGWSNHQKAAARLAARSLPWHASEVIFYNACQRPQLFKRMSADVRLYEAWKHQHSLSVEELATEWISDMNRMGDRMAELLGYPAAEDGRYIFEV